MKGKLSRFTIIALILAALLPYANIFPNKFVFDDFDFFVHWEGVKRLDAIPSFFSGNLPTYHQHVYRPVRSVLQAIVYALSQGAPIGFHIFSLTVQIAGVLLAYWFSRTFLPLGAAFLTALIFAVLPVHTDSISFMTASFDTAGAVIALAALWLYALYGPDRRWWLYGASIMLALIAYFIYEITIVLPLLLILYDVCIRNEAPQSLLRRTKLYLPYFAGAILYSLIRSNIVGKTFTGVLVEPIPFMDRMFTMTKAFVWYIYYTIVGWPLSIAHTIPVSRSLSEPLVLGSAALLAALLWFAVYLFRKNKKIITFAILWFFISLLPVSNVIQLATFVSEHYLYLASFSWAVLLGMALHALYSRPALRKRAPLVYGSILVVILGYGSAVIIRNLDWRDNISIFSAALAVDPTYAGGYNGLAFEYRLRKEYAKAEEYARKAIEINPNYFTSYALLGEIAMEQEQFADAIPYFDKAIEFNTGYASAYLNRGVSYMNLTEVEKAESDLLRALELYPAYPLAHRNLGIIYFTHLKFSEAIPHFEAIIDEGNDAQIQYGLGVALVNTGQTVRGRAFLEKALMIDPNFEPARKALEILSQAEKN